MQGRPRPEVTWTLNSKPLLETTNTTRVQIVAEGAVVQISYLTHAYEGLYQCKAKNRVGEISAKQMVLLKSTLDNDSIYARISYPVVVAVVASLILVLVLLLLAKLCYSKTCCCCACAKTPPSSPPTPRLKQYEMPFDQTMDAPDMDLDECRMTLTSRDGSISPYGHHRPPPSIVSSAAHCHCHYSACPASPMGTLPHMAMGPRGVFPKCSICDFSAQTLPMNRMGTLKRYDHNNPYNHSTLGRSGSMSPSTELRLSAEF